LRAYSRVCDTYLEIGQQDKALAAMETAPALPPSLLRSAVVRARYEDPTSAIKRRSPPAAQEHERELEGKQ